MEMNEKRGRMPGTMRLAAIQLLSLLWIVGCAGGEDADVDAEAIVSRGRLVRVETIIVHPQTFEERIRLTGTVEAEDDVTLSAEAGGRVGYIAELGTEVSVGMVVARFDERVMKSQAKAARAEFELARDTYTRQEALYADSVISALEFDNARSRRDQTAANYERAKKMYEDTRLTSTISGRIEARYVNVGELVAPGIPVIRVVDTRHLKIRAGVPERYAADIQKGARVTVTLSAVNVETDAVISFVGRVVDAKSRTFLVEIELDNDEGTLKPEMVADVSIERRSVDAAIVVPQSALVRDDLGTGVYLVEIIDGSLVANRHDVVTGPRFGGKTVIESGVNEGDQVVVVGQSTLTNGNLVEVVASRVQ